MTGLSEMQVRRLIASGRLRRGATGVCIESLRAYVSAEARAGEVGLRLQAIELLLAGRIAVPRPPAGRWGRPAPITLLPALLVPGRRGSVGLEEEAGL